MESSQDSLLEPSGQPPLKQRQVDQEITLVEQEHIQETNTSQTIIYNTGTILMGNSVIQGDLINSLKGGKESKDRLIHPGRASEHSNACQNNEMHRQPGTSINPAETDQYFDTVKANLSKLYTEKESWFIPLPWEDDLCLLPEDHFVNLEMQILDRNGQMDRGCTTNLEDLFNPLPQEGPMGPRQILIRGNAGYGKSTLLSKIGYNWAQNIDTFKSLPWKGTLLLMYRLRELEDGADIEEELLKLVQYGSTMPLENLQTTKDRLNQFRGRILILLDGYDELRGRNFENVQKFLGNRPNKPQSVFRSAITILTSRMISEKKFLRQFDRHFVIKGLTPENVELLISKYYKGYPEEVDSCLHLLSSFRTVWIQNLSPILVILICFVNLNENLENVETADKLFLRVMLLTAQRAKERENIEMTDNDIWDIFDKLGFLFLQHSLKKEVFVTHDELLKLFASKTAFVESCGILRKPASSLRKENNQFEPVHKLLMDCLGIYSMNKLFSVVETKSEFSEFFGELLSGAGISIHTLISYCENTKCETDFMVFTNREESSSFRIHWNEEDTSRRFSLFDNTVEKNCKQAQYGIRLKPKDDKSKCMEHLAVIFNKVFPETCPLDSVAAVVTSLPQEDLVFWIQTNFHVASAVDFTKDFVRLGDEKAPEGFLLFLYLSQLLRTVGCGSYELCFVSKDIPDSKYLHNYVKRLITDPEITVSLQEVELKMDTEDLSSQAVSGAVRVSWYARLKEVSVSTMRELKSFSEDHFISNGEELLNEYSKNRTNYAVKLFFE